MAFPTMSHDPTAYCLDQVRCFDRDRYRCLLFAPEPARSRLFALYAFNLEVAKVRETVSEPLIGEIRLQWWREAIAEFSAGTVRAHPVAEALAAAMAEHPIRAALLERILVAREFDLGDRPPENLAALEDYAEGSSGALQCAALDALGAATSAADVAATRIGIAWALIGLLRAVSFHARQRRLYLPTDALTAAGVDIDRLFEGQPGPGLAVVASTLAERAAAHLAEARRLRTEIPPAARPALLPAVLADTYRRRLERAGYELFDPALQQPAPFDPLRLAVSAWRGRY